MCTDDNQNCGCGCDSELPFVPAQGNPRDSVEVIGKGEIVVTPSIGEGGKKIFEVERVVYTPPVINLTANPTREVGETVDFSWDGTIVQGRNPITLREITPAGTDLNGPFTLTSEDVTRATRGFSQQYFIKVRDNTGTEVTKTAGIQFYNKVRMGFHYKDGVSAGQELTEADIAAFTATLADNIKSVYGGARSYVIPASGVQLFLFWLYESGTTPINSITLSGLPFPLVFIPGNLQITNAHNNTIHTPNSIVRSANKFGTGTLQLSMS